MAIPAQQSSARTISKPIGSANYNLSVFNLYKIIYNEERLGSVSCYEGKPTPFERRGEMRVNQGHR